LRNKRTFGPWEIEYSPADGGRIDSLSYNKVELLTTELQNFHPPKKDYGVYETRPVYGYDDCFPSVDSCNYPGMDWKIPDHGELCWLSWDVKTDTSRLIFSVESKGLPISFMREMQFTDNELIWIFKVHNNGDKRLPFQHVMHPLMPLSEIIEINLPEFDLVFDEIAQKKTDLNHPEAIQTFLLNQPPGSTNMLFLNNIQKGLMAWKYRNGLGIEATFSEKIFPSIGIWWNNLGYPDEENIQRNECALEPIPGDNSVLTEAIKTGKHLSVKPGDTISWKIPWRIINKL
jgi:hypothetical protein